MKKQKHLLLLARTAAALFLAVITSSGAWAAITEPKLTKIDGADYAYQITSAADLQTLSEYISASSTNANNTALMTFYLTTDITYEDIISEGITTFDASNNMIGYYTTKTSRYFQGTFDGQGHTITLNLTANQEDYGLFTTYGPATIRRLHVTGAIDAGSKKYVGGLIGYASSSSASTGLTVSSCWSSVTIKSSATSPYIAGFIGRINNTNGDYIFENCRFDGTLNCTASTNYGKYAGFISKNQYNYPARTRLNNCLQAGTVVLGTIEKTEYVGNFVGENPDADITNCYYTTQFGGSVQGTDATSMSNADLLSLSHLGNAMWEENDGKVVPKMSSIELTSVEVSQSIYAYTGSAIDVTPIVKVGTTPLNPSYYTISYKRGEETVTEISAEGTYTVTCTGVAPFTGTVSNTFLVQPEVSYKYWDTTDNTYKDGSVLDYTALTDYDGTQTLSSGWYVVKGANVEIGSMIIPDVGSIGDIHIVIPTGQKLTVGGILSKKANLHFYGDAADGGGGTLISTATSSAESTPGIGVLTTDGLSINIHGGNITATGSANIGHSSGIGSAGYTVATVNIYGGTVTANGGQADAAGNGGVGIGGSYKTTVNIWGGTVTANGAVGAAGIGGDVLSSDANLYSGWNVNIYGGNVTANGGKYGAGIGANKSSKNNQETTRSFVISGGTVTATGGEGAAGIGGAFYDDNGYQGSVYGNITISGGTVTATGGQSAAGIGGGNRGFQNASANDKIIIKGGKITATGGAIATSGSLNYYAPGIGLGAEVDGSSYPKPLIIWKDDLSMEVTSDYTAGAVEVSGEKVKRRAYAKFTSDDKTSKFAFDDGAGNLTLATVDGNTDNTDGYKNCQIINWVGKTIKPACEVTFDVNGGTGTCDKQILYVNGTATEPAAPTRDDNAFAGWYNGETTYDFSSIVTTDLTLTAKWNLQNPSVILAPTGYATYYNGTYDLTLPSGLVARIVTAEDGTEGALTYETIADGDGTTVLKTVPAGTAVMLYAAAAVGQSEADRTFTLTLSDTDIDTRTFASSKLHGSNSETTTTGGERYYKLTYSNSDDNFGWYWGAENGAAFTSPAHKAWLALSSSQAAGMRFIGLGDGTTGINVNANANANAIWYDLSGRRLNAAPTAKGIYIVNGKKVLR